MDLCVQVKESCQKKRTELGSVDGTPCVREHGAEVAFLANPAKRKPRSTQKKAQTPARGKFGGMHPCLQQEDDEQVIGSHWKFMESIDSSQSMNCNG